MLDIELCKQLLKLEDDWHVAGIELDEPSHRLDITIRCGAPRKKSLFSRAKTPEAQDTITLRHLPLGGYRTYLHVPKSGSAATTQSWSADNSSFTHEMEAHIVQTLNSCHSSQIAANLLGITADEVREISERTGAVHDEQESSQHAAAPVSMATEVKQHAGAERLVADVPAEDHPNWSRLIVGEIRINTSAVGLQMMLERVRLSVERNPSDAARRAGIKILRQFFLKHQSRLQSEIRILGGQAAPAVSSVQSTAQQPAQVPPESHPSWQRLINGELEIRTDVVALKMMLERIRISISNNPSDAARMAGARILRQYFLKYQNKHRAEIDQILAA